MRVMVLVKASAESESGQMPSTDQLNEMGKFNDELVKAGIMLAGEGLLSSAKGKRVRFSGKGQASTVIDGPFAEAKELVAGYWIWQVASLEEAVEWLKRSPFEDTEVEVRQVAEAEDFGDEFTPEMRQQEQKLRDQVASQQQ
jgi:hypothetical protein